MRKRHKDTYYIVHSDGKIYSEKTKRFLKPRPDTKGYLQVTLRENGKSVEHLIHRLVAENFIEKIDSKMVVNHKDFDITNNHVDNLEWVTQKENIHYSFSNSRHKKRFGEIEQINDKGEVVAVFETINEAQRKTGVTGISRATRGITKQSGGFKWRWR